MASFADDREKICKNKGCDDEAIGRCFEQSGQRELVFCQKDGYFFVKVDGRERLRTDNWRTAYGFFLSLSNR